MQRLVDLTKIIDGYSSIDESMVTGESMLVDKKVGDGVIGATINKTGAFKFKATKVGKETFLSQIIKMVEEAQASKAPIQKLADQVSSFFVPVIILIAIMTFIFWLYFLPNKHNNVKQQFFHSYRSASIGLSWAARFAGKMPKNIPTAAENPIPKIIVQTGAAACNGETTETVLAIPSPKAVPIIPPIIESVIASKRN